MEITKQQKDILLGILDKFVEVCEQNGLRYYLAGGSVLGAVRHKGFIPWDDDIDVYMPRKDYESLQKLPDNVWGDEMRLASWRKVKNYRYDFLKVELVNTTLIERYHPDYIGGVFMDIFPLDMVSDNEEKRQKQLNKVRALMNEYITSFIMNDNECNSLFDLLMVRYKRWKNRNAKILDEWESIVSACSDSKNLIVNYHSPWIDRPMPIEYIGEGVELEFEGKKYIVPSNYDAYLQHVFGDYMKLPPIEKRVGHTFDYVNYERRISEQELTEFLKLQHKRLAYHFSLKKEIKHIFCL